MHIVYRVLESSIQRLPSLPSIEHYGNLSQLLKRNPLFRTATHLDEILNDDGDFAAPAPAANIFLDHPTCRSATIDLKTLASYCYTGTSASDKLVRNHARR